MDPRGQHIHRGWLSGGLIWFTNPVTRLMLSEVLLTVAACLIQLLCLPYLKKENVSFNLR